MNSYQYSILRYVNNASSGEFTNIGVVMWIPEQAQVLAKINKRYGRLSHFFHPFDSIGYRQMISRLQTRLRRVETDIATAKKGHLFTQTPGHISQILNKIAPDDASCFQWSDIRSGGIENPEIRFAQLVKDFVERHDEQTQRERLTEEKIFQSIEKKIFIEDLKPYVKEGVPLSAKNYSYTFKVGWVNGKQQVLEPISFDFINSHDVIEKAVTWSGRLANLAKGANFQMTAVYAIPDSNSWPKECKKALAILQDSPNIRAIVPYPDFEDFIPKIKKDIQLGRKKSG